MKIRQKWFRMYFLEPFTADNRMLPVKKFYSQNVVTLFEEGQFIGINWDGRVGHKN